jgi:hypothetical protein
MAQPTRAVGTNLAVGIGFAVIVARLASAALDVALG